MNDIPSIIEAFLFSEGGSIRKTRLAKLADVPETEIDTHLQTLQQRLTGGMSLVISETEAALVVSNVASEKIREARKKELGQEIGDAGLEVLSIILYRGPSTRAQIDYIRGVNTASTVRNLLSRGLIERSGNPLDGREFIYRVTTELLAFLGIKEAQELPEYATISSELATFESQKDPFTDHASTTNPMHDGGSL